MFTVTNKRFRILFKLLAISKSQNLLNFVIMSVHDCLDSSLEFFIFWWCVVDVVVWQWLFCREKIIGIKTQKSSYLESQWYQNFKIAIFSAQCIFMFKRLLFSIRMFDIVIWFWNTFSIHLTSFWSEYRNTKFDVIPKTVLIAFEIHPMAAWWNKLKRIQLSSFAHDIPVLSWKVVTA